MFMCTFVFTGPENVCVTAAYRCGVGFACCGQGARRFRNRMAITSGDLYTELLGRRLWCRLFPFAHPKLLPCNHDGVVAA